MPRAAGRKQVISWTEGEYRKPIPAARGSSALYLTIPVHSRGNREHDTPVNRRNGPSIIPAELDQGQIGFASLMGRIERGKQSRQCDLPCPLRIGRFLLELRQ